MYCNKRYERLIVEFWSYYHLGYCADPFRATSLRTRDKKLQLTLTKNQSRSEKKKSALEGGGPATSPLGISTFSPVRSTIGLH